MYRSPDPLKKRRPCSRRFKYRACMAYHIRTHHKAAIACILQLRKIEMAKQIQNYRETKPIKVSVIKQRSKTLDIDGKI